MHIGVKSKLHRILYPGVTCLLAFAFFCLLTVHNAKAKYFYQYSQGNDCQGLLEPYFMNPELLDKLRNPIITSEAQLDEQLVLYRSLESCLMNNSAGESNPELSQLRTIIEYFLIFAEGAGQNPDKDQARIDLTDEDDPAVIRLSQEIGIPPPPGWIFIHYYSSRVEMPKLLQAAFLDPDIAGVTIFSKYVAILVDESGTWAERALSDQALPGIKSHELVHAYINSILAESKNPGAGSFPRWFEEGLASYISRSDRGHTIITPSLTLSQAEVEEYRRFSLIFEFLEDRLGEDGLNRAIRLAVESGDAGFLYRDLGFPGIEWLFASAEAWQYQRIQQRYWYGLIGIVAILIGIYAWLPELRCECGFTGRRRDFASGQCPDCGRSMQGAEWRPTARAFNLIYPDCQVCGRRFLPWQRDELKTSRRFILTWVENSSGAEQPLSRHVHRLCQNCQTRSLAIESTYRSKFSAKFTALIDTAEPKYREWLSTAPQTHEVDSNSTHLPFEQALEQVILAALAPNFRDWLDSSPLFEFPPEKAVPETDLEFVLPPDTYERVVYDPRTGNFGTLFRSGKDIISITWE